MRILDESQDELLKRERKLLNDLGRDLSAFEIEPADSEIIQEAIEQLDDLFLLVIVGEFNAGKSALINALLGEQLLQEGVTPTTARIHVLRYGEEATRTVINEHQHILTFPQETLAEISIVDTPGTNAVIREHETITSRFVPRADFVLFCTSADRPFTESERTFLEQIRDWGKKVILVVNKIDILESDQERLQVTGFVRENAYALLGVAPDVFGISARLALRAKQGQPALWTQSRFEPLEQYIHSALDQQERIRLKLLNPLGICSRLVGVYRERISTRLSALQTDLELLNDVDSQLALYQEDMERDFEFRMSDIEKTLFEMETRGQTFFDETFRLTRVLELVNRDHLQQEFEHRVVDDVPQQIERKVGELIDWLVDADLKQWQAVTEHLAERRREHRSRIVGDVGDSAFRYDRERLIEAIGREAKRVVDTYDKTHEAAEMADKAQIAVAASAAAQVGAVGLGAVITILATTLSMDVTGILMASAMAILGLLIIPARRRRGQKDMRNKVAELRMRLVGSLRKHFAQEIAHSLQRLNQAIAPYTRFVRAERDKLLSAQRALDEVQHQTQVLQSEIEQIS